MTYFYKVIFFLNAASLTLRGNSIFIINKDTMIKLIKANIHKENMCASANALRYTFCSHIIPIHEKSWRYYNAPLEIYKLFL